MLQRLQKCGHATATKKSVSTINQRDRLGLTPLLFACAQNHENIAVLLLSHPDIAFNKDNNDLEMVLAISIQFHHLDLTKTLISILSQSKNEILPLKPFQLEEKTTCLMKLAENHPNILQLFHSLRSQKVKSAKSIVHSKTFLGTTDYAAQSNSGFFSVKSKKINENIDFESEFDEKNIIKQLN